MQPSVIERGLGRRPNPDDNDHLYLMRALVSAPLAPLVATWVYRRGKILDQGNTGTCVAHAWRAWMDGEPLRTGKGPKPFDLYDRCILADVWDDNDHDPERQFGTSVRAGAQVLTALKHVKSYLWAFTLDDVRTWMLGGNGGVVFGVNWYSGMDAPSSEGIIRATGRFRGGHALYAFGIDDRKGVILLQNSWGQDWGGWPHPIIRASRAYRGCAQLPYEDLERLLREDGEACTAVEQKVTARPVV